MISTHILDTCSGAPACDVFVVLEKKTNEQWSVLSKQKTNTDGRIQFECGYEPGIYRLNFEIEDYFKNKNQESFFLNTPVVFKITNTNRKYHIPLLLNPFGYSSYRGS